jgi:hypothetical protein
MGRRRASYGAAVFTFWLIAGLLILGICVLLAGSPCQHGHHIGVCGREYRHLVGKVYYADACQCVQDHY